MNLDYFTIIIILFIILVSYRIYINSDIFQLKCIVSEVDGEKYCVRERDKLKLAANRLALVNNNMKKIVEYCSEKYPDNDFVKRLKKGYNPKKIFEILPTSKYTAYSENKGEKLAFCLNKKKDDNDNLIDLNTLTYVALHELSHIGSKTLGHTSEFWNNFKFLIIQAEKLNLYKPVDYKKNNKNYCGMLITDNPYYDI